MVGTPILWDGFDTYNGIGSNTGTATKWTQINVLGAITQTLVAGRFGGQAVRCNTNQAPAIAGIFRVLPSSYAALTVAHGFRMSNVAFASGAPAPFVQFREGATYHVHIGVTVDGRIAAYRATSSTAGTLLGQSAANIIIANTWHDIVSEVVINDTTGRVTVYVDDMVNPVLNLTAQDTRNAGTAGTIDTINLVSGNSANNNSDFDDVYILDAASKLSNSTRCEMLYPTSDVAQGFARSTGSANFSLVDETLVNGDTDYVQGSAVNDVDTYGFGNLSSTPANVYGVQMIGYAEKTDAGARSFALQVKSGATTSDGSNYALAASYSKFERILLTDPNTAAAWTPTNVDAITGGPKVTV